MGNLVSVLSHTRRAEEVILGAQSHIYRNEQGGMAALGGVHARTVANQPDGRLEPAAIASAINSSSPLWARTSLICLENTFSGHILRTDYLKQVKSLADEHQLKMHLDGARLFNASVASGAKASELAAPFDSVQFCFSKGLSAPVGSMICGSDEFIKEARRNRQLVGGAMRQVGVLAAACIVALEEMVDRLAEDHANARRFAEGLATFCEIDIDPANVETNIVFFKVHGRKMTSSGLAARLHEEGVAVIGMGDQIRAVTHYGIDANDIDEALKAFQRVFASTASKK
jgi:threonine aldolase